MSRQLPRFPRSRVNRRRFLKMMGFGAASAALLSACQPGAAPAPAAPAQPAGSSVRSEWVTGTLPADLAADFRYSSWEGEEEMRKWLLHFDNFFKENYPNVKVQGDWGIDWDEYWTKLPTQLAAGAAIDMMWMHDTRCKTFAANGWLQPLDDYLEAFTPPGWPDEFYPSQVQSFQFDGKQYGIPYDIAPGGLYVNLDLFEEAGVDLPTEETTYEEFLEIAKALTKEENGEIVQWGVSLPTSWAPAVYPIVRSFGGYFWNENLTESGFNQEGTIEAMQYLADLMWEHRVMPSSDMLAGLGLEAGLAFASGVLAIHMSLNDEAFVLAEAIEGKFNWGFVPMPKGPAGQFNLNMGSAFSIPVTSTQPDLAYELMRYTLTNPETLPISGEMGSQFTGNMNYYEYGLPLEEWGVDREAFKKVFHDLPLKNGVSAVYHPKYHEWETSLYATIMDPLWIGEERDAAKACMALHEQTNQLLATLTE